MVYGCRSSYTARVAFDLAVLRVALREARESKRLGRDVLAKKIGRAKSTIQGAEMGPDVPGVDTVALILEGLGIPAWEFFLQFDAHAPEAHAVKKPLREDVNTTTVPLSGHSTSRGGDAADLVGRTISHGADAHSLGAALLAAGVALAKAGAELGAQQADHAVPEARDEKPVRRRAGARRR